MKVRLSLIGLFALSLAYIGFADTVQARSNYICSYTHSVVNNETGNRSSITITDEVLIPAQCPPVPPNEVKADDPQKFSLHFTSMGKTEEPHDLSCTHTENPLVTTPLF